MKGRVFSIITCLFVSSIGFAITNNGIAIPSQQGSPLPYTYTNKPYADIKAEQAQKAAAARRARAARLQAIKLQHSAIDKKMVEQEKNIANPFGLTAYNPNYVMPFYYSINPYYRLYKNNLPSHQNLMKGEVKFQVSFRAPVWYHILGYSWSLYGAYTQLSYWQAYENSAFFRETNYEPEVFFERVVHEISYQGWHVKLVRAGAVHQSNGRGGNMERSWNRLYADFILANGNFVVDWKPWYVLHDRQVKKYNRDITDYLGHGRFIFAYKYGKNTFTLMMRNDLESAFRRGAQQVTYSYPLTTHFRLYIQGFHGYGQSLAEYNHKTWAAGIGFALSDYM